MQPNRLPYSILIGKITGSGIDFVSQSSHDVQSLSDVVVGRRAVAAERKIRQLLEQKVIFADPLYWLDFSQYRCTYHCVAGTTLMRRSFKVMDLFSFGLRLSIGVTDLDRASIP